MRASGKARNTDSHGAIRLGGKHLAAVRQKARPAIPQRHSTRATSEAQPRSSHPDPEQERGSLPPAKTRTGIVSVNGRDVGEMCCSGGRRSN